MHFSISVQHLRVIRQSVMWVFGMTKLYSCNSVISNNKMPYRSIIFLLLKFMPICILSSLTCLVHFSATSVYFVPCASTEQMCV